MSSRPNWFYVLVAIIAIALSLAGNLLTNLWTPTSLAGRRGVIVLFSVICVLFLIVDYLQRTQSSLPIHFHTLKELLSPRWVVTIGFGMTVIAYFLNQRFALIVAMVTLFYASAFFVVEKISLTRRKLFFIRPSDFIPPHNSIKDEE